MISVDNNMKTNIYKKLKEEIAINNFEEEINYKYSYTKNMIGGYTMKKRIIAIICGSLTLVSGIAFAANFANNFRGLGGGVDTAIQSGYIEKTDMNFINSNTTVESTNKLVNDLPVNVKVEDFLMDDVNLSTQFNLKFDKKINDIIDYDNIKNIELEDLIILDEENRIIYSGNNKNRFEDFCTEHNLNYSFGENNENYINSGLNYFPNFINEGEDAVSLIYNIYAEEFPKSKKLTYYFKDIVISQKNSEEKVYISGNWKFEFDVPEKMYTRTKEYYKVISCDNEQFKIYTANVSDTGLEIGLRIKDIEMPTRTLSIEDLKQMQTINEDLENQKISQEEANKLKTKYEDFVYKNNPISISDYENRKASYVEKDNGEIFQSTLSPTRKAHKKWVDKNEYDFYETFSMTKYNSTNKIKLVLFYYDQPVTIELEKINN